MFSYFDFFKAFSSTIENATSSSLLQEWSDGSTENSKEVQGDSIIDTPNQQQSNYVNPKIGISINNYRHSKTTRSLNGKR